MHTPQEIATKFYGILLGKTMKCDGNSTTYTFLPETNSTTVFENSAFLVKDNSGEFVGYNVAYIDNKHVLTIKGNKYEIIKLDFVKEVGVFLANLLVVDSQKKTLHFVESR